MAVTIWPFHIPKALRLQELEGSNSKFNKSKDSDLKHIRKMKFSGVAN